MKFVLSYHTTDVSFNDAMDSSVSLGLSFEKVIGLTNLAVLFTLGASLQTLECPRLKGELLSTGDTVILISLVILIDICIC